MLVPKVFYPKPNKWVREHQGVKGNLGEKIKFLPRATATLLEPQLLEPIYKEFLLTQWAAAATCLILD